MSTFALSNTVSDVYETALYSSNASHNLKTYTMNQLCIHSSRIAATSNMAFAVSNMLRYYALSNAQSNWNFASNAAVWASNQSKKFVAYADVLANAGAAITFASNAVGKSAPSNAASNWNWASNTVFKIADRLDNFVEKDDTSPWNWASNTAGQLKRSMSNYALLQYQDDWDWASNEASHLRREIEETYATKLDAEQWEAASKAAYLASNLWKQKGKDVAYASNTAGYLADQVVPSISTYWTKDGPNKAYMMTMSNVFIKPNPKAQTVTQLLDVEGLTRTGSLMIDSTADITSLNPGLYINFMTQYDGEARYGFHSGYGKGGHVWGKFPPQQSGTATMRDFTEQMRLSGDNGFLGVGLPKNTMPKARLHINGAALKSGDSMWQTESDRRIKENIVRADLDRCYDNIKKIPLRHFNWRHGVGGDDRSKLGWIAQEVEPIFPKAVSSVDIYGIHDCLTLNTDQIIATMYGTIQKLQAMVEELQESARADREALAQLKAL
jgi:hypothetical protein